jgi:hypothetical protein
MVQARDLNDHAKKQIDPQHAEAVLVMRNCAIESFLLHFRALREFFGSHQKMKADDLKATDYLSTWQTSAIWVTDKAEGERINKRLAHLSKRRTTLDNKWDLAYMEWSVSQTFEEFIAKLTPAQQQSWFQQATDLMQKRKPAAAVVLGADSNSTASGSQAMTIFPPFP